MAKLKKNMFDRKGRYQSSIPTDKSRAKIVKAQQEEEAANLAAAQLERSNVSRCSCHTTLSLPIVEALHYNRAYRASTFCERCGRRYAVEHELNFEEISSGSGHRAIRARLQNLSDEQRRLANIVQDNERAMTNRVASRLYEYLIYALDRELTGRPIPNIFEGVDFARDADIGLQYVSRPNPRMAYRNDFPPGAEGARQFADHLNRGGATGRTESRPESRGHDIAELLSRRLDQSVIETMLFGTSPAPRTSRAAEAPPLSIDERMIRHALSYGMGPRRLGELMGVPGGVNTTPERVRAAPPKPAAPKAEAIKTGSALRRSRRVNMSEE